MQHVRECLQRDLTHNEQTEQQRNYERWTERMAMLALHTNLIDLQDARYRELSPDLIGILLKLCPEFLKAMIAMPN